MDKIRDEVGEFIISEVKNHPSDIVPLTAEKFGFSRQRAHAYLVREIKSGTIIKVGNNRWTRYFLVGGNYIEFNVAIKPALAEDKVWSTYIQPMAAGFAENIQRICSYGFTEIFNNAIHHSEGTRISSSLEVNGNVLTITILDNGVGIFQKIKKALNLESARESLLHLSKGKFTTDPSSHTGEGIFFTSRAFDSFSILSDDMYYTFENSEWFLSPEHKENFGKGTFIKMSIPINSTKKLQEVFSQYSNLEIGFGKTIVAVALSAEPGDPHVSRSQAKRLLVGLEKFNQIVLDFKGVESAGQAFVDEVFRVFKNEHPNITIQYFNANKDVEGMIKRGFSNIPKGS